MDQLMCASLSPHPLFKEKSIIASEEIAYFVFRSRFYVSLAVLCFATDYRDVDKPKGRTLPTIR